MPDDDPYTRFVTVRAKPPPRTAGATLHWDGTPAVPVPAPPATAPRASPAVPPRARGLLPSPRARPIDWLTEAASLTFYLDPGLLLPTVRDVSSGATGTLLWVQGTREALGLSSTGHPALLVHTAYASVPVPYAELVPHLLRHDPLLHHMALVLQTAVAAEGVAEGLYAEALASGLAVHLLRRAATARSLDHPVHGGLTPSTLHRTTAYMLAHLAHPLSLSALAAVAQMSPAHFARLFKQATGRTPHQYVILSRIECAKQLLTETAVSLSDLSVRVGYTDQSHFTALFRRHVGTTPKIYRDIASARGVRRRPRDADDPAGPAPVPALPAASDAVGAGVQMSVCPPVK